MKERPILFSGPMVRALLAGRKTQTRRVVKFPANDECWRWGEPKRHQVSSVNEEMHIDGEDALGAPLVTSRTVVCPYGVPGDRLWCKHEHWKKPASDLCPLRIWDPFAEVTRAKDHGGAYEDRRESFESFAAGVDVKKCPSLYMPRWASRITLEVVGVRVERVQGISEADAVAESFKDREDFFRTFYDLNKRAPRTENPWVWVVEFKRITTEGAAGDE